MCQNVSNKIFSAWSKIWADIPTHSGVYVQGEWQKYTHPSSPLSKDEELKDIGHSMSIGNLILGVSSVTVSYLICYDSLLQNATDIITKCDGYFTAKCDRILFTKCARFFITKYDSFITKCKCYYKLWQRYCKM